MLLLSSTLHLHLLCTLAWAVHKSGHAADHKTTGCLSYTNRITHHQTEHQRSVSSAWSLSSQRHTRAQLRGGPAPPDGHSCSQTPGRPPTSASPPPPPDPRTPPAPSPSGHGRLGACEPRPAPLPSPGNEQPLPARNGPGLRRPELRARPRQQGPRRPSRFPPPSPFPEQAPPGTP